ncbi:hypothetical protein Tco_1394472 [Tanacetum coccineum]
MDSDKYLEGQSMQRPPLFDSDSFIYWEKRFETYVKSKDLDLWHVIANGDFQPIQNNPETKLDEAKKESSDEECSTSGSEDEEYAMAVRDFKKLFKCGDPNHLIRECLKPPKEKNQRAFIGGSWSDSGEEDDEKDKDETCLMDQASSEVRYESSYFSDESSSIDYFVLDSDYD